MSKTTGIFLVITALLFSACLSSGQKTFKSLESTEYNNSEIIDSLYRDIYGEWCLYAISGGFIGIWEDYDPQFYLHIKPFGIYGYFNGNTLQEFGNLSIYRQTNSLLLINLEPDPDSPGNIYHDDTTVQAQFSGCDTLALNFFGSDGYNYHYVRKQYPKEINS